jgi:hypothetical protein
MKIKFVLQKMCGLAFLATLQLLVTSPAVISITCLFFSKKKNPKPTARV